MSEEKNKTDPSALSESQDNSIHQLLVAVSSAISDRIALVVGGTLKHEGPAEMKPITTGVMWLRTVPADVSRLLGPSSAEEELAAAVALFPTGMRALITARVDARVRVSRSDGSLEVAIQQCTEPAFLFAELEEPYDATHALHLVCDPTKDKGYTFVMIEFSGGRFTPSGWLDGETAAGCAEEGAKSATGRPPDFRGTTRKSPK
jgi:hypothetical protein